MVGVVNAGTMLAALLVRRADVWGRRRVLALTIAGYTLCSLATAFAPEVYSFTVLQMLARVFLIGEWAIAMVYAAEEFPAARRGFVIGLIQGFASLGSIACAGLVPMLLRTSMGWRSVYLVGAVPLALMAFARRNIRETSRFEHARPETRAPLLELLTGPWRGRVLLVALAWFFTYACTQTAVTFWKEFAVADRGFTDKAVGASITLAAVGSMPFVFAAGKLLDVAGRRVGAAVIFLLTSLGVAGAYTLHGRAALTVALGMAIFGTSAVMPVLNAFTSELFPTEARGDAFALANNLLGRVSYVLAPFLVGFLATRSGWSLAVSVTAVGPLLALAVILAKLPETRGRELEDTAKV
jgi:putative MFS transporter